MKIILLGHYDFPSNAALSELVQGLEGHRLKIFLSGTVAGDAELADALKDLGAYDRSLCDRLSDECTRRGTANRRLLGFAELEKRTGAAIEDLVRPNSAEGIAKLEAEKPDLVISVRYRRILREQALGVPPLGVINLHSGLLPDYKGVMATFWAMSAGAEKIGSTLHYIDDGSIDTGRIISRQSGDWKRETSYLCNVLALYPEGCLSVLRAVRRLEAGESIPCVSQPREGDYFTFPDQAAIEAFAADGFRLYDGSEFDFATYRLFA
jgi:methionyl-tRNA formyltransferase